MFYIVLCKIWIKLENVMLAYKKKRKIEKTFKNDYKNMYIWDLIN